MIVWGFQQMERSAPDAGFCLDNKVWGPLETRQGGNQKIIGREKWQRVCRRVIQEQKPSPWPCSQSPTVIQSNQRSPSMNKSLCQKLSDLAAAAFKAPDYPTADGKAEQRSTGFG